VTGPSLTPPSLPRARRTPYWFYGGRLRLGQQQEPEAAGEPRLVAGPPQAIEMLTELGGHPRDQWEAIHERYRSHYAHDHPAASASPPR